MEVNLAALADYAIVGKPAAATRRGCFWFHLRYSRYNFNYLHYFDDIGDLKR